MEITLEKIELVKDRTGASYKEAKDALEQTDGNVVDAIIFIEDSIDEGTKPRDSKTSAVIDSLKSLIKKGNVSKLVIKKDDDTVLNLPVNVGIIGTVVFPWAMVAATIIAFGTRCSIEIVKDDGEIINVSNKAGEVVDAAKSKGGVIIDEVRDKSSEAFDMAKEKGKDVWDLAKDKSMDAFDTAKEKAVSALKREKKAEINVSEFEDLDLSGVDFSELEVDDE